MSLRRAVPGLLWRLSRREESGIAGLLVVTMMMRILTARGELGGRPLRVEGAMKSLLLLVGVL